MYRIEKSGQLGKIKPENLHINYGSDYNSLLIKLCVEKENSWLANEKQTS